MEPNCTDLVGTQRNPIDYGILSTFSTTEGGGGGGGFYLTLWKQGYDHLIDLKFITDNYQYKAIKNAKFQKLALLFLEIWRHKVRLFTLERSLAFRYLPPKIGFKDAKITLYDQNVVFLTQNYSPLHISAIFNPRKETFDGEERFICSKYRIYQVFSDQYLLCCDPYIQFTYF